MPGKAIIIIGAGIAGLSAGCYARMNGYQTTIFEMHDKPGGLCTSWKRKGYNIDGCIHWLNGSAGSGSLGKYWLELGALQDKKIVNHHEFIRLVDEESDQTFILYSDIDRLEKHMKALAPEDSAVIEELTGAARRFSGLDIAMESQMDLKALWGFAKTLPRLLPNLGMIRKYSKISVQDFAQRFKDPFLRRVFSNLIDMPDFPLSALVFLLADLHHKNSGYPIGGSLAFARGIEKRFLDLGGEIRYKARVEKILVENGRAVGIRLDDGSEARADAIISAADGHSTIFKMLEGRYVSEEIERNYRELPIFEPVVLVAFGVNRDLSQEPHAIAKLLAQPITIAGVEQHAINWRHYCYDPTLAPEGKSLLSVLIPSRHAYWLEAAEDSDERYEAEKKQVVLQVMRVLEEYYPGIAADLEMTDVATPLTFERYTGNWQGSYEGWLITTKTIDLMFSGKTLPRTLPGLENFHMIGQWVMPGGGLPSGSMTGRMVIQDLCKQDGIKFTTSVPAETAP